MQLPHCTALLIVDVQQGFDVDPAFFGGARNNPRAEERMADLLAAWRATGRPVVHVRHASVNARSPLRPELPGHAFKPEVAPLPGEPQFVKSAHSSFIGTGLEEHLRGRGIGTLVVVGLTTDHCVSTTVRMACDMGFSTYLVSDATAAFDTVGPDGRRWDAETVHALSLTALHQEFATIVTAREAIAAAARAPASAGT